VIRAVLFDIGGTLWSSPAEDELALERCYARGREALLAASPAVPSLPALIAAVEGYFAEWEDIWRDDPSQVRQRPTAAFVAEALKRLDFVAPPQALERFTDELLETSVHTARTLESEPGMKEALAELQAMDLRLGAVSNAFMGAATLRRIMDERGLAEHLEFIMSSCEAGIRKPDPEIYRLAAKEMGVAPEEAAYVGDRVDADVEGPRAVGMRGILTHQYRQEDPERGKVRPDAVIKHLRELPEAIRRLLHL
jgi:putative hydrolase of the HAD superfamily